MTNRLVEHIWTILECREEQTKTIIEQLLNDIQLFDQKQADYGPYNISNNILYILSHILYIISYII